MSKTVRRILNIVSTVLLIAVIALAVLVFAAKAQNKMVFVFGKSFVWVLTDSMEETIPAQSYILVEQVETEDLKVGDVIVFYSDDPQIAGSMNTHRIMEISEDGTEYITKGDNNAVQDDYTAKADKVVARYVRNLPVLTFFGRILTSTVGFFSMVAIVVILCLAFTIPDFVRYAKDRAAEKEQKEHDAAVEELVAKEVEKLKSEAEKEPQEPKTPHDDGKE